MKHRATRGNLLLLLLLLLALAPFTAPQAKPARKEEPAWYVGAWGLTYARYAPARYGPEQPLRTILESQGIPLDENGKLAGTTLLVNKAQRRCELWLGERLIKTYRIQLSQRSRGAKKARRDQRTPEGDYEICAHKPSKYHRGLWINYPNLEDAERGLAEKRIGKAQFDQIAAALGRGECPPMNTKLGGLIMLHGQQKSLTSSMLAAHRRKKPRAGLLPGDADPAKQREYHDWTAGCVAMFNSDIRELYELLPDGTKVRIVAGTGP